VMAMVGLSSNIGLAVGTSISSCMIFLSLTSRPRFLLSQIFEPLKVFYYKNCFVTRFIIGRVG